MNETTIKLRSVAQKMGIHVEDVDAEDVLEKVWAKFAGGQKRAFPLWECLEDSRSKMVDDFASIRRIPYSGKLTVIIDWLGPVAFQFESIQEMVDVFLEMPGFIFYAFNLEDDVLLCLNDHDVLIAVGRAKGWADFAK